jgi:hypothetical protein
MYGAVSLELEAECAISVAIDGAFLADSPIDDWPDLAFTSQSYWQNSPYTTIRLAIAKNPK